MSCHHRRYSRQGGTEQSCAIRMVAAVFEKMRHTCSYNSIDMGWIPGFFGHAYSDRALTA